MKKNILIILALLSVNLYATKNNSKANEKSLLDNDLTTYYTGTKGINTLIFDTFSAKPVLSYKIYSSGCKSIYDPVNWILKGSDDGKKWIVVDERRDQKFCSRYQEIVCRLKKPSNYKKYKFEITTASDDTLKLAEIMFFDNDILAGWDNFKYPKIDFKIIDPDAEGAQIYGQLVQNPDEYIRYHARKVAEILFYTANDPMNSVQQIEYSLKNYNGVSSKSGNPAATSIVYSTQHVEKSAKESLYKLDFETRGVLYHELVHAYQFEPKGIGSYSTNKEFWACIEGIADAVRAEAGYFDWSTRKPGGNWMDGYRTTGFFLQWLNTKDPNAIRKIHITVRDLDVWSFDKAIKTVFGDDKTIEAMWNEYQQFLTQNYNICISEK